MHLNPAKRFGGTGLGLTVCRQLVEQMQGELMVQSEVGRGSCFSFVITVPVPEVDADSTSTDGSSPMLAAQSAPLLPNVAEALIPAKCHAGVSVVPSLKPVSEEPESSAAEASEPVIPSDDNPSADTQTHPNPARQASMDSSLAPSFAHMDDDNHVNLSHMSSQDWSMRSDGCSLHLRRLSSCSDQFGSDVSSFSGSTPTTPTVAAGSIGAGAQSNLSPCRLTDLPPTLLYDTNPTCSPAPVSLPDSCSSDGVGTAATVQPSASSFASTTRSHSSPVKAPEDESDQPVPPLILTPLQSSYRRSSHTSSMQSRGESLQADGSPLFARETAPTRPSSAVQAYSRGDQEAVCAISDSSSLVLPTVAVMRQQSAPVTNGVSAVHVASPAGSSHSSTPLSSSTTSLSKVSPGSADKSPKHSSLNILCAEDNAVNQKVMRKLLAREGHTVSMVSDGAQAVELFKQHPDFDLILLDVCMPVMDGPTACKHIREYEQLMRPATPSPPVTSPAETARLLVRPESRLLPPASVLQRESSRSPSTRTMSHIPIIAVTASTLLEDKRACVDAGMDDVVVKPLTPASLRAMLRPIVARKSNGKRAAISPLTDADAAATHTHTPNSADT